MSEHTSDAPGIDSEQEEKVRTQERVGMDEGDMEDAIDQEQDQKVKPDDESRYEDDVDRAMSGDS